MCEMKGYKGMKMNTDRKWLLHMAEKEDGCFVGVGAHELCSDCPPSGYPTDRTRCAECPRKATLADVVLPTYCGCNELLQNLQELETHVERGCWSNA